eukprot:Gb_25699 [translate_table: standard]
MVDDQEGDTLDKALAGQGKRYEEDIEEEGEGDAKKSNSEKRIPQGRLNKVEQSPNIEEYDNGLYIDKQEEGKRQLKVEITNLSQTIEHGTGLIWKQRRKKPTIYNAKALVPIFDIDVQMMNGEATVKVSCPKNGYPFGRVMLAWQEMKFDIHKLANQMQLCKLEGSFLGKVLGERYGRLDQDGSKKLRVSGGRTTLTVDKGLKDKYYGSRLFDLDDAVIKRLLVVKLLGASNSTSPERHNVSPYHHRTVATVTSARTV